MNLVQAAKSYFAAELQRSFDHPVSANDLPEPSMQPIVPTPNVVLLKHITPEAEKMSIEIARVSSPLSLNRDYTKLLQYCFRHGHWSVFEHAHMTLEIHTSRTIARQILRHRSFTFQEFSQRYAEVAPDPVLWQGKLQSDSNRQGSSDNVTEEQQKMFEFIQRAVWGHAYENYSHLLSLGFSKESVRCLLPEGMAMTKMYMTGNLRSWIHYLQVRAFGQTGKVQAEHIDIAVKAGNILSQHCPVLWEAMTLTSQETAL